MGEVSNIRFRSGCGSGSMENIRDSDPAKSCESVGSGSPTLQ